MIKRKLAQLLIAVLIATLIMPLTVMAAPVAIVPDIAASPYSIDDLCPCSMDDLCPCPEDDCFTECECFFLIVLVFILELCPDAINMNPKGNASMYWDFETQTYYLRARNFNPRTGRFSRPDPFFHALHGNLQSCIMQSGNLYMYVMHNPVRFIDPWGLFAWNEEDDQMILVNALTTGNAGGTFSHGIEGGISYAALSIWGVVVTFWAGSDGVNVHDWSTSFWIRADVFYSTIVAAAGGAMTFLGGHGAFGGRFSAPHMFVAMFVSPTHQYYYNMFYEWENTFTSWGLRFGFFSGGGAPGFGGINPVRTIGQENATNYLLRPDLLFWNHLSSDIGAVTSLNDGNRHFMRNHSRTFPYSGRWTNSTSFTIGLVNAVGLNHGLSAEQVRSAWGINNAFAPRYFGR